MFCQNCVTCPSIRTDPGIPPPGYEEPGIRTHTGAGDTVWQPILNLYNEVLSEPVSTVAQIYVFQQSIIWASVNSGSDLCLSTKYYLSQCQQCLRSMSVNKVLSEPVSTVAEIYVCQQSITWASVNSGSDLCLSTKYYLSQCQHWLRSMSVNKVLSEPVSAVAQIYVCQQSITWASVNSGSDLCGGTRPKWVNTFRLAQNGPLTINQ